MFSRLYDDSRYLKCSLDNIQKLLVRRPFKSNLDVVNRDFSVLENK